MPTAIRRWPVLAVFVVALLAVGGISGCAQKRTTANWQHPTLPKEAWAADIGECRRYARRIMEREAGLPATGAASDNVSGGLSTYNSSMTSYQLARVRDQAFDSCMRRLGYQPVVGK